MIFTEELKNKSRSTISSRGGLYFKDHDMKNLENAVLLRSKTTGFVEAVDAETAREVGADEYCAKTQDLTPIIKIVKELLQG